MKEYVVFDVDSSSLQEKLEEHAQQGYEYKGLMPILYNQRAIEVDFRLPISLPTHCVIMEREILEEAEDPEWGSNPESLFGR